MSGLNNMRQVLHNGEPTWANSTKPRKVGDGWHFDYRCTKCGSKDHALAKEK